MLARMIETYDETEAVTQKRAHHFSFLRKLCYKVTY